MLILCMSASQAYELLMNITNKLPEKLPIPRTFSGRLRANEEQLTNEDEKLQTDKNSQPQTES